MRSYIFTERERRILKAFVKNPEWKGLDPIELSKILYRFRHYKDLAADVELYFAVRRSAEPETVVST